MSARAALPFALFLLVVAPLTAAAGPWSLAPGDFFAELRGGVGNGDSYHDWEGERQTLFRGGEHEERALASYVEMGWTKRFSIVLGMPVQSVTRRFATDPLRPTTTGFGDGLFGLKYNLANGNTAMALQLDWRPPLGYQRDLGLTAADSLDCGDADGDGDSLDTNCARQVGNARLGEGVQDVTLALHVGTTFGSGFFQAAGGYRYRFEDPDDQIAVTGDAGWWFGRSLLLAGNYVGDFASANPERVTDKVSSQRVGPRIVYRVDPNLDVFAGSLHTLMANNALHLDSYYVGIAFRETSLNRLQGFLGGAPSP